MTSSAALLAALLAAATGCASLGAERARQARLLQEVGAHEYQQPEAQVWDEVRRLLDGLGLSLAGKDAEAASQDPGLVVRIFSVAKETVDLPGGGRMLETGFSPAGVRYRAEARPGTTGVRVALTRITEDRTNHGHDGEQRRDPDLELQLLRRLDAAAAAEVEARLRPGAAPSASPASPAALASPAGPGEAGDPPAAPRAP